MDPQPFWGFDDILHKFGTKLHNCFYVIADRKKENKKEFYYYKTIYILEKIKLEGILLAIENGDMYIDFDVRSGHNHGTKFRIRQKKFFDLYEIVNEI